MTHTFLNRAKKKKSISKASLPPFPFLFTSRFVMAFNPLVISCCLMHLLFNLVWLEPGRIKAHGRAQAINSQPLCVRSVDKWGKLKEIHYWSDRKFHISARVVSFLLLTTFFHLCTPCDIPQLLHSHWSVHSPCLLWSALWLVNGFDTETHTNTGKQTKHAALS